VGVGGAGVSVAGEVDNPVACSTGEVGLGVVEPPVQAVRSIARNKTSHGRKIVGVVFISELDYTMINLCDNALFCLFQVFAYPKSHFMTFVTLIKGR
jgi:hypothetical protein